MQEVPLVDVELLESAPCSGFAAAGARTISWSDALAASFKAGAPSAAAVCHATIGLIHSVPEPLRHNGRTILAHRLRCLRPGAERARGPAGVN